VVAADRSTKRTRLVAANAQRTGATSVSAVVAEGTASPFRNKAFDRVLVDAPCSGLGVLRRRADARWRIDAEAIERLTKLQTKLLAHGAQAVKPGGRLVYSVCTVTRAETCEIAATIGEGFESIDVLAMNDVWRPWGSGGGYVLPQDQDSDGMAVFAWQRVG
jgi:16S rRNA (cytosine967-C5)-methyltransferase